MWLGDPLTSTINLLLVLEAFFWLPKEILFMEPVLFMLLEFDVPCIPGGIKIFEENANFHCAFSDENNSKLLTLRSSFTCQFIVSFSLLSILLPQHAFQLFIVGQTFSKIHLMALPFII